MPALKVCLYYALCSKSKLNWILSCPRYPGTLCKVTWNEQCPQTRVLSYFKIRRLQWCSRQFKCIFFMIKYANFVEIFCFYCWCRIFFILWFAHCCIRQANFEHHLNPLTDDARRSTFHSLIIINIIIILLLLLQLFGCWVCSSAKFNKSLGRSLNLTLQMKCF